MQFRGENKDFARALGLLFHLSGFEGWHCLKKLTWKQLLVSLPSLPGCQELNELVGLLICFNSGVYVLYLLGHLWEVPAAASQTDAGRGGTGAQPRVWHWWWLVLPQEVKATWLRRRSRGVVLGRTYNEVRRWAYRSMQLSLFFFEKTFYFGYSYD